MKRSGTIFCFVLLIFSFFQCQFAKRFDNNNDLVVLDSLKNVCNKLGNSPELLRHAKILLNEASKKNNDYYKGCAYGFILLYYEVYLQSDNKMDSIRFYGEKSKEYLKKGKAENAALLVEADILRWEMNNRNPESNIDKILNLIADSEELNDNKAISEAYSVLGEAYYLSNSPKEAIKAFETSLNYIRRINTKDSPFLLPYYIGGFSAIADIALTSKKDNDMTLAYCDSIYLYIENNPDMVNMTRWKMKADVNKMHALSNKGDFENATPLAKELLLYCDSIEKKGNIPTTYYRIEYGLSNYFFKKREYNKALKMIDNYISSNYFINSILEAKDLKADILAAQGKFQEAYMLKSEIYLESDSINQTNASRQVSEMYTLHNVDKLEREAIENNAKIRYSQIIIIFVASTCILLLVICIILKCNSYLLKKKNEKIFAHYKEIDKYRNEIKELTISEKNQTKLFDNEPSLFDKTEDYLLKTHCYRDPNINREALAAQVGTNRQYLTQAIQENLNMTFHEYINHHRLECARVLLCENMDFSIEDIYILAGFNNRTTFYRLFKKKYGLTPKEVRNIAIANDLL